MRREFHMVYGDNGIKPQGWVETSLGWNQVSPYELDNWPMGSYSVIDWPQAIPKPTKLGPPRETW